MSTTNFYDKYGGNTVSTEYDSRNGDDYTSKPFSIYNLGNLEDKYEVESINTIES